MKTLKPVNRNLFNIYSLFTREPFLQYFATELEFYTDGDGLLGVILLDRTDQDYSVVLLSRDAAKQYRAENIKVSLVTIEQAREAIEEMATENKIVQHDNKSKFFDLFKSVTAEKQRHPFFELLENYVGYQAAKEVIKEISYHYKDIDGNFIDQFQSLNGFDARLWELFLFCFCREEYFSFNRTSHAPDFLISKSGTEIALEAVIINRTDNSREAILNDAKNPLSEDQIAAKLKDEMPLKYANTLNKKLQKRYWELPEVKGKPFVLAVADFHATMSMTWSFPALLEYIFGQRISHDFDENNELRIHYTTIPGFTKPNGSIVPAGFFEQQDAEHISAILYSNSGTISKFNRMGKQAGFGSEKSQLIRMGFRHDHEKNAVRPLPFTYQVDETMRETWAEGVAIFHNPNALHPLDPESFPSVAHHFLEDERIFSIFPEFFPYSSITQNLIIKD